MTHELLEFLDGETDTVVERMEAEMEQASSDLEFEKAARRPRPARQHPQGHRQAADGG
ncbi:MAG: UvrB/UvrC motif-containing protein [Acidimicrobiales bacterium]|nr:UvrB/UvrC motif-containing protein [Acidimicrobiales bacterium]